MKKSRIKALTLLSNKLPLSYQVIKYGEFIKGYEVYREKDKGAKVPGDIHPEGMYKKTSHKLIKINHLNRLKNAYARNKEQGIIDYIQWLNRNNYRLNQIYTELNLSQVDAGIMDVINKGAVGFWKNILIFLMSFIKVFKQQKV